MRKLIYYIAFLLLMFIIYCLPASALEYKTCTRTLDDLHVKEEFIHDNEKNILNTPCVSSDAKIYDIADLLSDEEEEKLFLEVEKFIKKTNYDLVLVTTNENPQGNAQDYADDFYDYNDFGLNERRDGVLLLIDMDTRELYMSTTGYGIKMFDDARIDSIIDYGYSYIINEQYYLTFLNMINRLNYFYNLNYPESNENLIIDENGNPYYYKKMPYKLITCITIILTSVISMIFYKNSRLKIKALDTTSYLKSKDIKVSNDRLVNTIMTHTPRVNTSSSGGSGGYSGGSSGGSSFHTSSSGSSHGGGGRHF